ncbi:MAG: hypothetical protein M3O84_06530, partial [Actinomycetota bacterium]|nr:hypothetical protein [Actinomycetota bacterium]
LYTIASDGTDLRHLTSKPVTDEYPDWRPGCTLKRASPQNCGAPTANDVSGGAGDDLIFTGPGNDHVSGGDGNDVIVGGAGTDALQGQGGDDRIAAGPGPGRDHVGGGAGSDYLDAKDGKKGDQLTGGPDKDVCRADRGDKTSAC